MAGVFHHATRGAVITWVHVFCGLKPQRKMIAPLLMRRNKFIVPRADSIRASSRHDIAAQQNEISERNSLVHLD